MPYDVGGFLNTMGRGVILRSKQVLDYGFDTLLTLYPPPPRPPSPSGGPPPPPGSGGGSGGPPGPLPRWVKPSGSIFPWIGCPPGYSLYRVSPFLEVPAYSCLLNGAPNRPLPDPSLWDY